MCLLLFISKVFSYFYAIAHAFDNLTSLTEQILFAAAHSVFTVSYSQYIYCSVQVIHTIL